MKDSGGALGVLIGFAFLVGVLFIIGLWWLVLLGLAALVFLILWIISRRQHKTTRNILRFRPRQLVPAEVWAKAEGRPLADGEDIVGVTIVGLDEHSENWAKFAEIAEIDRAGELSAKGYAIAYLTPTADRGVILAYDRLVLGHIRAIELERYFETVWSRGGILHIAFTAKFDATGKVLGVTAHLPIFVGGSGVLPAHEGAAWRAIWGGFSGNKN